jgi:superfamily II DNA helicase RecQ
MQFVAVPTGSGYSVEAQVANAESTGGIQIMVTPIKNAGLAVIQVKSLLYSAMSFRV